MTAAQIMLKHLISALVTIQQEIDEELARVGATRTPDSPTGGLESVTGSEPDQSQTGENRYLSVEQVSILIGLKKSTVYKLISTRRIPYVKMGSRVLFNKQRIVGWMEGKSVDPIAPRKRA